MERDVYVPPAYSASTVQIRTPLMNDLVQRLAGALSVNLPQVKVPPRPKGDAQKNQQNSTKLERWTQAFLAEIEHQENDRIFYRFLDYLCGDGHGVLKLVHRSENWDQLPEFDEERDDPKEYKERHEDLKSGMPIPFSLKAIDPLTFLPLYTERGLLEVLEVSKRPRVYVGQEFGVTWDEDDVVTGRKFETDSNISLSGDCEFWEHWTKERVDYYVDRKWVGGQAHGYDRVPYFHALGTQTSSREPDKEGLSVGHQLIHIIPALDALLTMKTNSAFISAYPTFKRERDMGAPMRNPNAGPDAEMDDDGYDVAEEFEPGHIYDGLPGERLEAVQLPGVGKDVDESIQHLLGLIDKVGVPSVLSGNHSPNRVSGFAYSEMLNVSRTKYTTIIRNASFALESMVRFLWWLIEHKIGEDVSIWGQGEAKEEWLPLGPSDINGYYNVKIIVEPLLPEDDISQGQHAAAMVQAGLWSKRYARENKMGIPNPEEMEDEILVEKAQELPQVQMYLLMQALQRMDMDDLAEVFQMTAQMVEQQLKEAAGGGGGPVGRPGLPNQTAGVGGGGQPGTPNPMAGTLQGGMPKPPPPGQPGISPV